MGLKGADAERAVATSLGKPTDPNKNVVGTMKT